MMNNSVSEKIGIFLSCRNLKDLDYFSKSDPYVKVYFRRDFNVKQYALYGRTETATNNLNPDFKTSMQIEYIFQCRQDIRFDVLDDDNGNDDFIGSCQTTIGALMGAKNQTSILDLKCEGKPRGKLVVRCQKLHESNSNYLRVKCCAQKLMNTDSIFDFWDKSDPYLKFLKLRDDNTYVEISRTNTIHNNLNPSWNPIQMQLERLVNEKQRKFKVECWDWEENGKDNFIGEITIDFDKIKNTNGPLEFPLFNPKKKKPGVVIFQKLQLISKPSFIDYLKGGLQLNMIVAIDFTGSNGDPKSVNSLHYRNPTSPNQYQSAILGITGILMNYDTDKRIPCFGFGAQLNFPQLKGLSHCFPLSGDYNMIEATGVQHLIAMYSNSMNYLSLSGPTYFSPILSQTMKLAQVCKQQGSRVYQTLLILTDGDIHDMDKTIDLIYDAAKALPLSIIIVGIGNAGFENMVRLDGDGGVLYTGKGQKVPRDIVQFVPFRQVNFNPDMLAKELLAELPGQIVQYMTLAGISPGVPNIVSINEMVPIVNPVNQQPKIQKQQININQIIQFDEQ